VVVKVADRDDPLVAFLGESIAITDEIYQIRDFDVGGSRILLSLDPTSVDLARPDVHRHPYGWPLAWTRSYGGGREFYTALGHEEAARSPVPAVTRPCGNVGITATTLSRPYKARMVLVENCRSFSMAARNYRALS
jgi:type 1 glutamine amidotransferase